MLIFKIVFGICCNEYVVVKRFEEALAMARVIQKSGLYINDRIDSITYIGPVSDTKIKKGVNHG